MANDIETAAREAAEGNEVKTAAAAVRKHERALDGSKLLSYHLNHARACRVFDAAIKAAGLVAKDAYASHGVNYQLSRAALRKLSVVETWPQLDQFGPGLVDAIYEVTQRIRSNARVTGDDPTNDLDDMVGIMVDAYNNGLRGRALVTDFKPGALKPTNHKPRVKAESVLAASTAEERRAAFEACDGSERDRLRDLVRELADLVDTDEHEIPDPFAGLADVPDHPLAAKGDVSDESNDSEEIEITLAPIPDHAHAVPTRVAVEDDDEEEVDAWIESEIPSKPQPASNVHPLLSAYRKSNKHAHAVSVPRERDLIAAELDEWPGY